ncbi:MAG: hypothetical protein PHD48_06770 [Alphaproteobacteria bacterium]|nr:hypothetical protein [Alphaproteobacteria bacterium]
MTATETNLALLFNQDTAPPGIVNTTISNTSQQKNHASCEISLIKVNVEERLPAGAGPADVRTTCMPQLCAILLLRRNA